MSHFKDEVVKLEQQGELALASHRLGDVNDAMFAMLKAGAREDWHAAPQRLIVLCLRGVAEITVADGEKRLVKPGQFMLLEDTRGKGHITRVVGSEDHVALMIAIPDDVLVRSR
jgi:quercetin dioxygenase-like cupin family protein